MDIKSAMTPKNICFTLLVLFVIFLLVKMTDIALLLFCSYVISCAINPFVDKLSEKMPRGIATTLMIILILLVTLGILTPIVIMSISEISDFMNHLPHQIEKLQNFILNFQNFTFCKQKFSGTLGLVVKTISLFIRRNMAFV